MNKREVTAKSAVYAYDDSYDDGVERRPREIPDHLGSLRVNMNELDNAIVKLEKVLVPVLGPMPDSRTTTDAVDTTTQLASELQDLAIHAQRLTHKILNLAESTEL